MASHRPSIAKGIFMSGLSMGKTRGLERLGAWKKSIECNGKSGEHGDGHDHVDHEQ